MLCSDVLLVLGVKVGAYLGSEGRAFADRRAKRVAWKVVLSVLEMVDLAAAMRLLTFRIHYNLRELECTGAGTREILVIGRRRGS